MSTQQDKLTHYLTHAGLENPRMVPDDEFIGKLDLARTANLESSFNLGSLFTYPVPKLSPDGSCSLRDDPEEKPYDLRDHFNALYGQGSALPLRTGERPFARTISTSLFRLNNIIELLHKEAHSDWTGVYCRFETSNGPALIKLAYRGRPSRAEFPLTKEFAAHSNNATVGITGKAILIKSVRTHLEEGKPYYECDASVQSELCVPIFTSSPYEGEEGGGVVGIIDLESFRENHFTHERILKAAITCISVSEIMMAMTNPDPPG